MSNKIYYEDVKNDIEKNGWLLKSTEYINLNTDLNLTCPEGHDNFLPYKTWRTGKYECPICKQNKYYKPDNKIVKKAGYRILAFDQASITSGWAVYDEENLIKYGTYTSDGKNSTNRIALTKEWVASMIMKWNPDEVIFEDIQLQKFGSEEGQENVLTYKKLAHLQGVLVNYAYEINLPFKIVPPATWRSYSEIKGKYRTDRKKNAQLKIKKLYDVNVTQDEADAILIGRWAAHEAQATKIIEF